MRLLHLAIAFVGVLLVAPGCQVRRTQFQMDSDGRTPFFGIDLMSDAEPIEVRPIREAEADARSVDEASADRDERGAKPKWPRIVDRLAIPRRIPLPRTDVPVGDEFGQ